MFTVSYYANNSGGYDWLDEADRQALLDAGWTQVWDNRYTLDVEAQSEQEALTIAIMRWEDTLPLQYADAEGCPCCGRPHSFTIWED